MTTNKTFLFANVYWNVGMFDKLCYFRRRMGYEWEPFYKEKYIVWTV